MKFSSLCCGRKVLVVCLFFSLFVPSVIATSLEETISSRRSHHGVGEYTTQNITQQQLLEVLQAAYGKTPSGNRTTSTIGGNYPLEIYIVNTTASYLYLPETNAIALHDESVNKTTIYDHIQRWNIEASVVLVVVWNQTRMSNHYFASAEAGCLVQNVYLEVVTLGLGTCCVGSVRSLMLRRDLGLSSNIIPLLVMPVGYPVRPVLSAEPDFNRMNGNLPRVKYSSMTLEDARNNRTVDTSWSSENVSLQELSQVLWAAYGYTSINHRTTPSANNVYPIIIHVLNETGVYEFLPDVHSVSIISSTDKRSQIAEACNVKSVDIPILLLFSYNSHLGGDGSVTGIILDHEYIEIDVGCVIQNVLLEATAWNLSTNVVIESLEDWNGSGSSEIRTILNMDGAVVPLYVMPIGHRDESGKYEPEPEPEKKRIPGYPSLAIALGILLSLFILEKVQS